MSVEEIMVCSDIKLLLLGDGKFAEIRNIGTPKLPGTWPCPMHNTRNGKTSHTEATTNKRKRTKTMCRDGRKPGSSIVTRQAIKSSRETPTHLPEKEIHNKPHCERISTRPLCDNRSDIDYSVLNDGYDVETSSPKRRRRHSSRPQSEPTAPRQAAQKKIAETKIHLSSQYDNLDLEKIMDSQYPALQLVPLSGVTNGIIDRTKPSEEEYIIPVLGTLMVHGITENKPDPDNIDLEEMASTENKTENTEAGSELHSTPPQTQPDDTPSPKSSESLLSNTRNGVTIKLVQDSPQILQQANNNGTTELHGVMNSVEPDQEVAQQPAVPDDLREDELLKGAINLTEPMDNSVGLKGVTNTPNTQVVEQLDTDTVEVNGVTKNYTQTSNSEVSNAEQNKPETLPDLVLNENSTVSEANTTEDEDEAAAALLQLSKSVSLPDEDTELPLGVLPVDAAPVPITLGNQDVLNAIENFKQTNGETGVTSDNSDNTKMPDVSKKDNNKKENNNKDKKDNSEPQSTPESSPPTSPAKGSLVIVKHGIR